MVDKKIPILFLIFRRKDTAIASFQSIKQYKPNQLYIAADGPRPNRTEEKELCEQTRNAILAMIDWECELHTLFREENLGCANAVYQAINWFFEKQKWGIIIEDDCVLHPHFYRLNEELLPYYENEEQVMQICAHNAAGSKVASNEYVFAHNANIWGWATWKRAWQKMDMQMTQWPNISFYSLIKEYGLFQACFRYYFWNKAYTHLNTSQSWATRWNLTVFSLRAFCISSVANLSINTGIGNKGGTHYEASAQDPYKHLQYGEIVWPLKHPTKIECNKEKVKQERKEFKRLKLIGIKHKLKKIIKKEI